MQWLSPTQLTTFGGSRADLAPDGDGCPRKWAYQYVARLPKKPQSPGAAFGQEVQDEQVDPYLRDGRWFDFTKKSGEVAVALAPLLPQPKTVSIREKFWMPVNDEYGYQGELDVWHPESSVSPGIAPGAALVGDVKTLSDLRFALSDATLARDVQAIVYAAHAVFQRGAKAVELVWYYARTRKPHRVQRARARMSEDQVLAAFERVDVLGRAVARLRVLAPAPESMPINVRTCESYGGCSYRHVCNLSPDRVAAGVMEGYRMNNPQQMFSQFMNGGTAPTPSLGTPLGSHAWYVQAAVDDGHVPQALVAREGVEGAWSKLQYLAPDGWFAAKQASLAPPPPPPPAPASVGGPSPTATAAFLNQMRSPAPPAINPPESALPPAPPVGGAAPAPAAARAPAVTGDVVGPATAPATRGPGRPKKEEGAGPTDVAALASLMRVNGIKRLEFDGFQVKSMELA